MDKVYVGPSEIIQRARGFYRLIAVDRRSPESTNDVGRNESEQATCFQHDRSMATVQSIRLHFLPSPALIWNMLEAFYG